jgi:lipid-binding SYLF domain-containing protein
MTSQIRFIAVFALTTSLLVACASMDTTAEKDKLIKDATASRQEWSKIDPSMEGFAKKGYGYAFFPDVGKGGFIIGGAHGNGVVYEQGKHIGYAEVTEGSIGLLAGGQTYSQLIVFENKAAMDRFKSNEINFGASASAVIAKAGAGGSAQFVDGIAVFVRPITGAMAEASLGGQRIKYFPK